jgi:hypothetical protein
VKRVTQRTLATLTRLLLLAGSVTLIAQEARAQQRGPYLQAEPQAMMGPQAGDFRQDGQIDPQYGSPRAPFAPGQAMPDNDGNCPCEGCGGPYCGQSHCAICGGGSCCPPLWSVDQGTSIMFRGRPRYQLLGMEFLPNLNSVNPDLSSKSPNFTVAAGYDLTVDRYLGRDKAGRDDFFEFNFGGFNSWQDTRSVKGERLSVTNAAGNRVEFGNLMSGFAYNNSILDPIGGFNRADFQSASYESDLYNCEFDLRLRPRGRPDRLVLHSNGQWLRECQPGQYWSYLLGLHYMLLNESFKFHSAGQINTSTPAGTLLSASNVTGDYNAYTHNNLLALIIGTEMSYRRCRGEWGAHVKIGPAINMADQSSDIVTNAFNDPFTTTELDRHSKAKGNTLGFLGGVGLFASYRLQPDLIAHAGYDMLWVNGLALAPEQFSFELNPPPRVNTNGMILYQSLTLSLEKTW